MKLQHWVFVENDDMLFDQIHATNELLKEIADLLSSKCLKNHVHTAGHEAMVKAWKALVDAKFRDLRALSEVLVESMEDLHAVMHAKGTTNWNPRIFIVPTPEQEHGEAKSYDLFFYCEAMFSDCVYLHWDLI